MEKKSILTVGVAVILSAVAGLIFGGTDTQTVIKEINQQSAEGVLGALSGPDINSPYIAVGGVPVYYQRGNLTSATTTVCDIQSPAGFSRLLSYTVNLSTGTSSQSWTLATSAARNAQDATLRTETIDGNKQFSYANASSSRSVVPSNTWVSFGIAGNATDGGNESGTAPIAGTCSAIFQTL